MFLPTRRFTTFGKKNQSESTISRAIIRFIFWGDSLEILNLIDDLLTWYPIEFVQPSPLSAPEAKAEEGSGFVETLPQYNQVIKIHMLFTRQREHQIRKGKQAILKVRHNVKFIYSLNILCPSFLGVASTNN